jgi:hypothetical protein
MTEAAFAFLGIEHLNIVNIVNIEAHERRMKTEDPGGAN